MARVKRLPLHDPGRRLAMVGPALEPATPGWAVSAACRPGHVAGLTAGPGNAGAMLDSVRQVPGSDFGSEALIASIMASKRSSVEADNDFRDEVRLLRK